MIILGVEYKIRILSLDASRAHKGHKSKFTILRTCFAKIVSPPIRLRSNPQTGCRSRPPADAASPHQRTGSTYTIICSRDLLGGRSLIILLLLCSLSFSLPSLLFGFVSKLVFSPPPTIFLLRARLFLQLAPPFSSSDAPLLAFFARFMLPNHFPGIPPASCFPLSASRCFTLHGFFSYFPSDKRLQTFVT